MPIPITCGNCGVTLKAPDNAAGRKVRCAKCGEGIVVPAAGGGNPFQDEPPPMPAPTPARARQPRPAIPDYDAPVRPARGGPGGSDRFSFDGSVGDFLGTAILAWLLTVFTCYIGFPWALCMIENWRASHTLIGDRRLRFVGTGGQLFVLWLKCLVLTVITFGIYGLWVVPAIQRWLVENTEFADR